MNSLSLSQPTQNVFIQTDYCKRNVDWGVVQSSDSGLLLSPILAEYRSFKSLNITFHFLSLCFASINSPWHSLTKSTHQLTELENSYTQAHFHMLLVHVHRCTVQHPQACTHTHTYTEDRGMAHSRQVLFPMKYWLSRYNPSTICT